MMTVTSSLRHSPDEVRAAKKALLEVLSSILPRASVGIGMAEDRSDYALTVTVDRPAAAKQVPDRFQGLEVQVVATAPFSTR